MRGAVSVDTRLRQTTISRMKIDDQTDEELAMIVSAGRHSARGTAEFIAAQNAYSALYDRNAVSIQRFVSSRLSSSAKSRLQDTCQEVWLRAWNKADSFTRSEKYLAWLFVITRRLMIDNARAAARKREETSESIETTPDHTIDAEAGLIDAEQKAALATCLQTLDELEADVLRLRLAGTRYPDVCEELSIGVKVAYKKWDTGKKKMADCMEAKQV